jgi:N-acetyl-anhydromuramyl-L-alanine amidase AmpD
VRAVAIALLIAFGASCGRTPRPAPAPPPFEPTTHVVACGEPIEVGTPVVLWHDPIGFDAYSERCRSVDRVLPSQPDGEPSPRRYGARSGDIATLDDLRRLIRLVVVHYDAVGSAERCFRALHDNRGLSSHFLLDLDGTIYQTLDLRERAFHARDVNDESIGIEIANIGAMSTPKLLEAWYGHDDDGEIRNLFPAHANLGRQRRDDVIPRPARPDPVRGSIHGSRFVQYDFTPEQYEALALLLAGLSEAFPRVRLEAPRDARGRIPTGKLDPRKAARFEGIVGHYHLDDKKYDPGPAFDWDRVLSRAREGVERGR